LQLLDVTTGQIRQTLPVGKPVRCVKFSPDQK